MAAHRRTKILATLGPSSWHDAGIAALIRAGASGFRLNFSHGDPTGHLALYKRVRAVAARLGVPAAILQDLPGPKLRTGELEHHRPVTLVKGRTITLTTDWIRGTSERVHAQDPLLPREVRRGDKILLDDGTLALRVRRKTATDVECVVLDGGPLGEHKGINLPGVKVHHPTMSLHDKRLARLGARAGMDYIALSFVRKPSDMDDLRRIVAPISPTTRLVAKIERPEALGRLDAVVTQSDAVMVARGDLGIEMPIEQVPVWQKRILRSAGRLGRMGITATQMLDSMRTNPIPTRAEVTDVANAILDGTDTVMLSGETATGEFPVETVRQMARIIDVAEANLYEFKAAAGEPHDAAPYAAAAVRAACDAAASVHARAIVVFTASGSTARLVARLRPEAPLIALSQHPETVHALSLVWGVRPFGLSSFRTTEQLLLEGERFLRRKGVLKAGDTVVFLAGRTGVAGAANLVKIHRVGATD